MIRLHDKTRGWVTLLDDTKDKSMETHGGEARSTHRVWLFYHD